jgi:hypothetical protein
MENKLCLCNIWGRQALTDAKNSFLKYWNCIVVLVAEVSDGSIASCSTQEEWWQFLLSSLRIPSLTLLVVLFSICSSRHTLDKGKE